MITPDIWNGIFDKIKENYSGVIKLAWFEITDDTIKSLEGKIFRNKLIDLAPLKDIKFLERNFVDNLRYLNFKEEEIEVILSHAMQSEGNFPQLQGICRKREVIITTGKTEISFAVIIESDFEIILTTEGKFSSFKKKFSALHDIVIGVEDFDKQFIIKGNPEEKVKNILSYEKIRNLIRSFEPIKSLTLDKSSLNIIKNITKNEEMTEEKINFFINTLVLLAGSIENPEEIKGSDVVLPLYKREEIKKELSLEEKFHNLEIRLEKLEKIVEDLSNHR